MAGPGRYASWCSSATISPTFGTAVRQPRARSPADQRAAGTLPPRLCLPPCVCHPPRSDICSVGSVQQSERPGILLLELCAAYSRNRGRFGSPMDTRKDRPIYCLRPGGGHEVTSMSQSRHRWPSPNPGNSVSRTQCRLHARGAGGEGSPRIPWRYRQHRNSLYCSYFELYRTYFALPGTRIADYRSETVRSGPGSSRLDGAARFVREAVFALSPLGNWRCGPGDSGPEPTRRLSE
jgi:hypothetical protein